MIDLFNSFSARRIIACDCARLRTLGLILMELKKKVEILMLLRLLATVLLVLTVCLIVSDSQTKVLLFSLVKKASFRDLHALLILTHKPTLTLPFIPSSPQLRLKFITSCVLVCIDSAAAAYNVLQILRCFFLPFPKLGTNLTWLCYLLDQATVYLVFASNSAATQASLIAITGQSNFQWMKLCDRFTRFCIQIGAALACNLAACIVLAVISCVSACHLFRLYSPKQFLQLKHK